MPRLAARTLTLAVLGSAVFLAGCTREERTINVYGGLSLERDGAAPTPIRLEGRLMDTLLPAAEFEAAWSAVTRQTAPFEALALSLHGGSDADAAGVAVTAGLVLLLPTPLRTGNSFAVGRALQPPGSGMPMYWNTWGGRPLAAAGVAEIALRVFDYHTIGMRVERDFVAVSAAGTITVLDRGRDWVDVRLDITATSADGSSVRIHGDIALRAERYTPPFS
jgi:hypothetical protein